MTSRGYFGKMNSTLGSVVPLAMFLGYGYFLVFLEEKKDGHFACNSKTTTHSNNLSLLELEADRSKVDTVHHSLSHISTLLDVLIA